MKLIYEAGYICCGCGKRTTKGNSFSVYKRSCLCNKCYNTIKKIPPKSSFTGTDYCDFVISPFFYTDLYRDIFLKFKFNDCLAYGHLLGKAAAVYFDNFNELTEYDGIIIVPLSKERLNERGFNQSEILGNYISTVLKIPVIKCAEKAFHTKTQSKLKGLERINNVKNSFRITTPLTGKRIIVFDDIFTTGSTVNELSKEIKNAGATSVCAVTAGYVYHELKPQLY